MYDRAAQKKREWVTCDGGPLLLIPEPLLTFWEGSSPPSGGRVVAATFRSNPDGPATDYDRACDVSGLGVIPVGPGHALVLNDDEPFPTTEVGQRSHRADLG
jgi:hypothetical protein